MSNVKAAMPAYLTLSELPNIDACLTLELRGLFRPPNSTEPPPPWLSELQGFRGKALYANGRRSEFRAPNGSFVDPDENDKSAYHLILRDGESQAIAGCVRYSPLESIPESRIRALAPQATAALLASLNYSEADVLEGGRLIIAPTRQRSGLGTQLLITGSALACILGRRLIWGTAGTRERQIESFERTGYRALTRSLVTLAEYDDDISMIYSQPHSLPLALGQQVDLLAKVLRARLS